MSTRRSNLSMCYNGFMNPTHGSEEYFDILDENGNKTGRTKLRSEVHRDGDWHRAVHIWAVNDKGEILLQRRAPNKDTHPNFWDISAGGHLQAGDDPLTGAAREVKEEIGLDIPLTDFQPLCEHHSSAQPHPGFINNSFYNSYIIRTNKTLTDMTRQESEVSELKFVPFLEFKTMVENNDPNLVPHSADYRALIELLEPEFGEK